VHPMLFGQFDVVVGGHDFELFVGQHGRLSVSLVEIVQQGFQ
jgi:hypothetical protein